ncbi:MAG TPA: hypothetical protein VMF11_07745 [Candidatus Baltobacteraceae bacterium]|nr:hypothetical protein [Candidatus Baltobacteraceae bacterium]
MISDDELAAIAAALAMLIADRRHPEARAQASLEGREGSRWKLADRNPELEIEDVRALR